MADSPLFEHKHYGREPVFQPANLMRETRRQKGMREGAIPTVCVLDPDGDVVERLLAGGEGPVEEERRWACYHSRMYRFFREGREIGIVGNAVGGPYAVLLAEQMFVSGCELLISITSAGQIVPVVEPPYFVLIDRALRDEGTSHHYLPPGRFAEAEGWLVEAALAALESDRVETVTRGASWTTDAPYRETAEAIEAARSEGILAVEMEAASLYAFARARRKPVLCFAHITNRMGVEEGDFEKGEAGGSAACLDLIGRVAGIRDALARRGTAALRGQSE